MYFEEDFVELIETQYASYTAKVRKPELVLYSIGYDEEIIEKFASIFPFLTK